MAQEVAVTGKVLVTGSQDRVEPLRQVLASRGMDVVAMARMEELAGVAARLAPGSLCSYVQLPVQVSSTSTTVVARVRDFLTQGLLARFDAAIRVLPLLAGDATVLLVAGNSPGETGVPDDQRARLALLRVLAHSILAEGPGDLRVTVLDRRPGGPEEIAKLVGERGPVPLRTVADYADYRPDVSYDDWRLEVLSLATLEA
jgi:hypothetical protein